MTENRGETKNQIYLEAREWKFFEQRFRAFFLVTSCKISLFLVPTSITLAFLSAFFPPFGFRKQWFLAKTGSYGRRPTTVGVF